MLVLAAGTARAQQTNAERMGRLAVECVSARTTGLDPVRLSGPDRLPFVRQAVVSAWHASGVTMYDSARSADSLGTAVDLGVTGASVAYAKADAGQVERVVTLALRIAVTTSDGRILSDDLCERSERDLVDRDAIEALEDPVWPETVGVGPPRGFLGRVLQPVIITAATVAGVVLFFSLRSRRSNDGG